MSLYKQSLKKGIQPHLTSPYVLKFIQPFSLLSYISRWKEPQWGDFCLFYLDAVLRTVTEIVPIFFFLRMRKLKFHMAALVPACDVQVVLESLRHITSRTRLALPFFLGCGFIGYMHTAHDDKKRKFTVLKIKCVRVKMKPIIFFKQREKRAETRLATGVRVTLHLSVIWHQPNTNTVNSTTQVLLCLLHRTPPPRCCWVFCTR